MATHRDDTLDLVRQLSDQIHKATESGGDQVLEVLTMANQLILNDIAFNMAKLLDLIEAVLAPIPPSGVN